jgi:hypothetical protein
MVKWPVGIFLGFLIVAGLVGSYEHRDMRERRQRANEAFQMIRQETDEKAKLAALGDVSIDPAGLTLGKLNDILQRQPHKLASVPDTTRLGWVCGGELCAIEAAFFVPRAENLPSSTAPLLISVSNVGFGKPFQGSIGGVHLGDSVEALRNTSRRHGNEPTLSQRRIPWDKDWEVGWTDTDGHAISSLTFFNKTALNKAHTVSDGGSRRKVLAKMCCGSRSWLISI